MAPLPSRCDLTRSSRDRSHSRKAPPRRQTPTPGPATRACVPPATRHSCRHRSDHDENLPAFLGQGEIDRFLVHIHTHAQLARLALHGLPPVFWLTPSCSTCGSAWFTTQ